MFLHIRHVEVLAPYWLRLAFDNGVVKEVDLSAELYGEVFDPLQDGAFFAQVALNPETGTIEWPNGADFAPEFLYAAGREVKRIA
jgi:hypothetical protein